MDVPGFIEVLNTYQFFPDWTLPVIAVLLILFELRLAEWFLFGKNIVVAALLSVLLHSGFTLFSAITLLRGLELPNCGCFGVFLARPLTWWTVVEDLVLVGMSFCLMVLAIKEREEKTKGVPLRNPRRFSTEVF